MKLPDTSALRGAEHRFLYARDMSELHNPDRRDFTHQMYVERFQCVPDVIGQSRPGGRVFDA